ncbi:hypothetical protein V5O48_009919 [Marasmius crinis-equi]|uniref:Integral membrane protein n=1 Tax=Marasmius crinis-equi TaxID=585013 RepID=A0ABR3F9U2_9AGAR
MPSVRVRRSHYSTLTDTSQPTSTPLHSLYIPPEQSNNHHTTTSPTSLRDGDREAIEQKSPYSTVRSGRRRAGSRVYSSLRLAEPPLLSERPSQGNLQSRRPATAEGVITYEGSATDIQLPGDDHHSLIGSALNLPQPVERNGRPAVVRPLDDIHHHDDIVEHLEVIDPQVATVSHLTNAANSILIPPLAFYSRKPVVMLSDPRPGPTDPESGKFEDSLDRHVDDVMRRRDKLRRTLKGVWSFLKTPMGIITGIYGFLVVFWGAAIVLFLAKIINLHNADRQGFWVEVSSQVVNALFTITGIGLAPSRILDTYRIAKIYHYKRRTARLRKEAGLPQLYDPDDLPDPAFDPNYVHVLTDKEQKDLHRQQRKFQYSQTWYRPHGTETHRAYPISYALTICCLNDGNSIFQAMLCGCMWSQAFERPPWTTGTLIPASFLCGIFSAVFIARGSAKSKRTKEVKEKLLASLAMEQQAHHAEDTSPTNRAPAGNDSSSATANPEEKATLLHVEAQKDNDLEPVVEEHMTVPSLHTNNHS